MQKYILIEKNKIVSYKYPAFSFFVYYVYCNFLSLISFSYDSHVQTLKKQSHTILKHDI